MRWLRSSGIVALACLSALVVVGPPAFATPNITASSGTSPVSPFITPIGNTRSASTARSTDSAFSLPSIGVTMSCTTSTVSGYVDTTHTQLRLTSVSFGGGDARRNCRVTPAGTIDNRPDITCTATSANPWFLHVKNTNAATRSSSGTINPTSACTILMTFGGVPTTIVVDANQSCRTNVGGGNNYTQATRRLSIICSVLTTIRGATRASTTSTFAGNYNVTPDTRRDGLLTVTAAS
jgi:hypothetical protein